MSVKTQRQIDREHLRETVTEFLADQVDIGPLAGEQAVTVTEALDLLDHWLSALGRDPRPTGTRNLTRQVIVECMVDAGAKWDSHRYRLIGARLR